MHTTERPRKSLGSRFRLNNEVWGVSRGWAAGLLCIPLLPLPIAIASAVAEHPWFYDLTVEDGPIEWLQVAVLALAGILYLGVAVRLQRGGNRFAAILLAVVAVTACIVVGEEISWGQRLLGWSTPGELEEINRQRELNLHNIGAIETLTRIGQFGASGYAALVPILALVPGLAAFVNRTILVPPLALVSFFVVPFGYWAARIPIDPARPMRRFSEFTELGLYVGLAILGWLTLRRLGREANRSPRAAGRTPARTTLDPTDG